MTVDFIICVAQIYFYYFFFYNCFFFTTSIWFENIYLFLTGLFVWILSLQERSASASEEESWAALWHESVKTDAEKKRSLPANFKVVRLHWTVP